MMTEAQKIARARRRVEVLTGFYIHAAIFAVILLGLLALNLATATDWWVQWVAVGWGAGLLLHALLAFGRLGERVAAWQVRKVYQLKSRM